MAAITTYATLTSEVQTFLHRGDVAAEIDVWIGLIESKMNRRLRMREMIVNTTLSVAAQTVALPADYLQLRNLDISASPLITLKFVTSEQRELYDLAASTGQPRLYTITGSNLFFAPTPDATYTANIEYYGKIPTLPSNTSNWVITGYPDAYFYGVLFHAYAWMNDAEKAGAVRQEWEDIIDHMNSADDDSMFNESPRMRADVCR